jgi:hypothetical protein
LKKYKKTLDRVLAYIFYFLSSCELGFIYCVKLTYSSDLMGERLLSIPLRVKKYQGIKPHLKPKKIVPKAHVIMEA